MTASKLTIEAEVEGLGQVYQTENNLAEGLKSLREIGINSLISERDLAFGRLKTGAGSSLTNNESYTSASFIYAKNHPPLLKRMSPLLTDPELLREAMDRVRNGMPYGILHDSIDLYLMYYQQAEEERRQNPEEREVLILSEEEQLLTSDREYFLINGYTYTGRFLFQDIGKDYYNFLHKEFGYSDSRLHLLTREKIDRLLPTSVIVDQLFFYNSGRGGNSVLSGAGGRIARDQYRIRGVLKL